MVNERGQQPVAGVEILSAAISDGAAAAVFIRAARALVPVSVGAEDFAAAATGVEDWGNAQQLARACAAIQRLKAPLGLAVKEATPSMARAGRPVVLADLLVAAGLLGSVRIAVERRLMDLAGRAARAELPVVEHVVVQVAIDEGREGVATPESAPCSGGGSEAG
jgi:hypothetical protein